MGKYLITGGAGFIGSNLCQTLIAQGHTVHILDNFDPFYDRAVKKKNLSSFLGHDNFQFHEIDFRNKEDLQQLLLSCVGCRKC